METIEHGSKTTRYVETKVIPLALLTKHPDAEAFGADVEDRTAQASSVTDVGLLDPVAVMFEDDRYLILDGCGRYDAMQAAGAEAVLCMVVELHGITPREYAMHRNTMGRRVTTGQRLMCYLAINQTQVMAAAEEAKDAKNTGAYGGRGKVRSRDRSAYSSRAVAERLGVSDKDVRAGIALLQAVHDEEEARPESLQETYDAVMDGRLPIRRWKPAYEGKVKTKGKAKAATDYSALAIRTMASLGTVFAGWQQIVHADRGVVLDTFAEVLEQAPEDIRVLLMAMYAEVPRKSK